MNVAMDPERLILALMGSTPVAHFAPRVTHSPKSVIGSFNWKDERCMDIPSELGLV
jgi:hypothetical protein